MDFPFSLNDENYESDETDDIDYNKLYNYYDRCLYCNTFNLISTIQINMNQQLYLCYKCKMNYINNEFSKKLNRINKYILFTDIKERRNCNEIKFYFIDKIYKYNKNPILINIFNDLKEMDNFIIHLRNTIIYHPGYPFISTFISLQKNI